MLELKQYTINKKSSERSFGFVFSLFFFIMSIFPIYFQKEINLYFLIISIIILMIAIFKPLIFFFPNKIWMKLGELLNFIISPLVMLMIFIFAFLITKIFLSLFNKKLIYDKFDSNLKTYWTKYQKNKGKMKDQY